MRYSSIAVAATTIPFVLAAPYPASGGFRSGTEVVAPEAFSFFELFALAVGNIFSIRGADPLIREADGCLYQKKIGCTHDILKDCRTPGNPKRFEAICWKTCCPQSNPPTSYQHRAKPHLQALRAPAPALSLADRTKPTAVSRNGFRKHLVLRQAPGRNGADKSNGDPNGDPNDDPNEDPDSSGDSKPDGEMGKSRDRQPNPSGDPTIGVPVPLSTSPVSLNDTAWGNGTTWSNGTAQGNGTNSNNIPSTVTVTSTLSVASVTVIVSPSASLRPQNPIPVNAAAGTSVGTTSPFELKAGAGPSADTGKGTGVPTGSGLSANTRTGAGVSTGPGVSSDTEVQANPNLPVDNGLKQKIGPSNSPLTTSTLQGTGGEAIDSTVGGGATDSTPRIQRPYPGTRGSSTDGGELGTNTSTPKSSDTTTETGSDNTPVSTDTNTGRETAEKSTGGGITGLDLLNTAITAAGQIWGHPSDSTTPSDADQGTTPDTTADTSRTALRTSGFRTNALDTTGSAKVASSRNAGLGLETVSTNLGRQSTADDTAATREGLDSQNLRSDSRTPSGVSGVAGDQSYSSSRVPNTNSLSRVASPGTGTGGQTNRFYPPNPRTGGSGLGPTITLTGKQPATLVLASNNAAPLGGSTPGQKPGVVLASNIVKSNPNIAKAPSPLPGSSPSIQQIHTTSPNPTYQFTKAQYIQPSQDLAGKNLNSPVKLASTSTSTPKTGHLPSLFSSPNPSTTLANAAIKTAVVPNKPGPVQTIRKAKAAVIPNLVAKTQLLGVAGQKGIVAAKPVAKVVVSKAASFAKHPVASISRASTNLVSTVHSAPKPFPGSKFTRRGIALPDVVADGSQLGQKDASDNPGDESANSLLRRSHTSHRPFRVIPRPRIRYYQITE
ncbi:MAG: hypothetical protein M1829_005920 [Trizodia sp. TS-e1964]|nr:MAG: hypothetical protein M1829_005920 [Trizodia sp. TS-e1964]